jgi:hypothetical protein
MKIKSTIKFINHACIQFKKQNTKVLFDPWFHGKVFNNSWSLLKNTNINNDFNDVTHICISHEHPDHLHFGTLNELKKISKTIPTLIFPERTNQFVKSALDRTGFKIKFASRDGVPVDLGNGIKVSYFGEHYGHDNSIVLAVDRMILLNQNDHYTSEDIVKKINQLYPKIDFLFTQFSLAGYYGNSDDKDRIKKNGYNFHIHRLLHYANVFNPKIVIPFASYVYFCHYYNQYLNDYIVTPQVAFKALNKAGFKVFLPYYGDDISLDTSLCDEKNKKNLPKLTKLFNKKSFVIDQKFSITLDKLFEKFLKVINEIKIIDRVLIFCIHSFINFIKNFEIPKMATKIYLEDINTLLEWNIILNKVSKTTNNRKKMGGGGLIYIPYQINLIS